ncbi:MAG TPA: phage tail protein [Thermoanaerobaculia bacterium]|jgi:phage tail-like protein
MPPGPTNDPFTGLNFRVELEGIAVGAFSECSGLVSEVEVIEYRSGSDRGSPRKLPGVHKYANIVLKRGYTSDRQLWDWHKTVLDGQVQRKAGSIVLLNDAGQEVLRWNFREGWPTKYEGPSFNAKANDVAIETLEITHEGFELA